MEFVDLEEAKRRSGLRLVVVGGVPSPWSEAAKGILHVERIPFVVLRMAPGNGALAEWTGQSSAPVAIYDDEAPRGGWAEILLLAERLAPAASLLPGDPEQRALLFGLSHEICGEMGLGWCRRLTGVHDCFDSDGKEGYARPIAEYLAGRYGYRPGEGDEVRRRVHELLRMLSARLHTARKAGNDYYLGDSLTALDVYSAVFMALFRPLPTEQCAMPAALREAFGTLDTETEKALDPILIEHRDRVYDRHLELPLSL